MAAIQNSVEIENFSFRPKQSVPEYGIHTNGETEE
jgi:hypothetical protein